jgi:hypothetical protein
MSVRLRADDFPIPHPISGPDYKALCESFKLVLPVQELVRFVLDDITLAIACMIQVQKIQPDRRRFLRSLKSALSAIDKARALLTPLAPVGLQTVSPTGPINVLVSSFPIKAPTSRVSAESAALNPRVLRRLRRSIERNPITVVPAILDTIADVLTKYIEICRFWGRPKGGRTPFMLRTMLICKLADLWEALKRRVSSSPRSEFVRLVSLFMEYIGWPGDDGQDAEGNPIPAAVAAALRFRRSQGSVNIFG